MKNNDYAQTNCHYAPVKNESYYAQNYASIMCQALYIVHMLWHDYRMSVSFENENKLHEYLHIIMFNFNC